jgi:hypothetical protein
LKSLLGHCHRLPDFFGCFQCFWVFGPGGFNPFFLFLILSEDKLGKATEKLRKEIAKIVRYDVLVGLVLLPDGGYIITTNLRTRNDVRGLVDPSFIAFTGASHTSSTHWKSRMFQIWLSPFSEGWVIPTAGTRKAQQKGKDASRLGWLGVVEVKTYRTWLEKTFRPLPRTTGLNTIAWSEFRIGQKLDENIIAERTKEVPDPARDQLSESVLLWKGACHKHFVEDKSQKLEVENQQNDRSRIFPHRKPVYSGNG